MFLIFASLYHRLLIHHLQAEQSVAPSSLYRESPSPDQIKDHRTDFATPSAIGFESSSSLRDSTPELHGMCKVDTTFRGLDITPATTVSPSGGCHEVQPAEPKEGGKKP